MNKCKNITYKKISFTFLLEAVRTSLSIRRTMPYPQGRVVRVHEQSNYFILLTGQKTVNNHLPELTSSRTSHVSRLTSVPLERIAHWLAPVLIRKTDVTCTSRKRTHIETNDWYIANKSCRMLKGFRRFGRNWCYHLWDKCSTEEMAVGGQ